MLLFIRTVDKFVKSGRMERGQHVIIMVHEQPYEPKHNYFWDSEYTFVNDGDDDE